MIPINFVYYANHTTANDNRLIAAKPLLTFDNTPHGPYQVPNPNLLKFQAAGIQVYSYITSGYENGYHEDIPNDLESNLAYIDAMYASDKGIAGIFLDEVSNFPDNPPYNNSGNWDYLRAISAKCRLLGLKLIFNTGVGTWDDRLMDLCDYMNARENYSGGNLQASEAKWASRTLLLSVSVKDANTAATITKAAIAKGILACYAGPYTSFPTWFEAYISQLGSTPSPTASLSINSIPTGASITIGGTRYGTTPSTVTLNPGTYTVLLSKVSYQDYTTSITLVANQSHSIAAVLTPVTSTTATLVITANISGATAYIDGEAAGVVPQTRQISAGTHAIKVSMTGYQDYQTTVILSAGQTRTVMATLVPVTPTTGTASFASTPAGASIFLDGVKLSRVTPLTESVATGSHKADFMLAGYKTYTANFSVNSGQTIQISATLVKTVKYLADDYVFEVDAFAPDEHPIVTSVINQFEVVTVGMSTIKAGAVCGIHGQTCNLTGKKIQVYLDDGSGWRLNGEDTLGAYSSTYKTYVSSVPLRITAPGAYSVKVEFPEQEG